MIGPCRTAAVPPPNVALKAGRLPIRLSVEQLFMTKSRRSARHLRAIRARQYQATTILLSSTLLMITWKYFGSVEFYQQYLANLLPIFEDVGSSAAAYTFLALFVLLAVVPAMIVKFLFRQSLADYGICLGNKIRTTRLLVILVPVFLLTAYIGAGDPAMREHYPIDGNAGQAFPRHTLLSLCYFIGWEFHFRGYLQFGLRKSFGWVNAIVVQTMASAMLHIGSPTSETYMAVAGGLAWGAMAFRTRSILTSLILHTLLGVVVDYLIVYS